MSDQLQAALGFAAVVLAFGVAIALLVAATALVDFVRALKRDGEEADRHFDRVAERIRSIRSREPAPMWTSKTKTTTTTKPKDEEAK